MTRTIRIGTRQSRLAMIQANRVLAVFRQHDPDLLGEIVPILTEGDKRQDPISTLGGKGVFVKALDQALLDQKIDVAVHSLKDVTAKPDHRLCLSAFLKAESVSDCLVFRNAQSKKAFGASSRVATGSLRRKALLLEKYPDLQVHPIRGNVDTRLQKLSEFDAIMLSYVGLLRLERKSKFLEILDPTVFIPAPGQGVIALQTRRDDLAVLKRCEAVSDPMQTKISKIDVALLERIGFDCQVPLGFYTTVSGTHCTSYAFVSDGACTAFHRFMRDYDYADREPILDDLVKTLIDRIN